MSYLTRLARELHISSTILVYLAYWMEGSVLVTTYRSLLIL